MEMTLIKYKENNISFLKYFLYALIISIVCIFLYFGFYEIDSLNYLLSFGTCFVKSLVLCTTLYLIYKASDDNYYSGGGFLLISAAIYNQISIIKYSVDYFYAGAVSETLIRVGGSILIDLIIIISSIIYYFLHKKIFLSKRFDVNIIFEKNSIFKIFTYLLVILFSIVQIYSMNRYDSPIILNVSRTQRTFVQAFIFITYGFAIFNIERNDKGRIINKSILPLLVLVVINMYITLATGKKSYIIVFGMIALCGLLYCKKISFKTLFILAIISPLFVHGLTILSEYTSGRNSNFFNLGYQLRYHAFRFDLSDFATTIAINYDKIDKPINLIREAFRYSIPSFILSDKDIELSVYASQMTSIGLDSTFDYNDTFFSMGAQVGGFLGMAIVFIFIFVFFEILSLILMNIPSVGPMIFVVVISYFSSCESDWSMFIFQTRDIVVYILVSYLFFNLFKRVKIKEEVF